MGYGGMGWVGTGWVRMGLLDWAGRDGKALDGMDAWADMGLSQWVHRDRLLRSSKRHVDSCQVPVWHVFMSDASADEDGEA